MRPEDVFERVFGTNRSGELILTKSEYLLASYVCELARVEIDNNYSQQSKLVGFDKQIEAAVENFERVVKLFKISSEAKNAFLKKFDHWSSFRKNNIKRLKEIAEEIQTDKFNGNIAKVVGGVVGALGGVAVGLSFLTPLAVITLPLAIGGGVASAVGGGVVVGTAGTEIVLLKNKLEEAKTLIMQEQASFSTLANWFTHTNELKEALNSLIDYKLFKNMSEYLQDFYDEVKDVSSLTSGDFGPRFEAALKLCIKNMCKFSDIINKFGAVIGPIVMTFVVVLCLLRHHNKVVLDCILQTDHLVINMMSMMDIGVETGQLVAGLATKGTVAVGRASVARIAVMGTFVAAGIVIDVLNVVLSSIEIHNRPETENAKKVKEAAEKLDKEFKFIKSVYDELKNYRSIDQTDLIQWKTAIILHVPKDAGEKDIKLAVADHIPEQAWGCIMLQRLSTDGNNWEVKVPAIHSTKLLRQNKLTIKREPCLLMT